MSGNADRLRAMNAGPQPLILPNVWDPVSARAYADAGFGALATSSSAVAATLGCRDGETPKDEMFAAIARIARSVTVPVTADIENGYSLAPARLVPDCVYPILAPPEALAVLVQRTAGPVNAMHRPGGPTIADLAALGVARITFGGGLHAQLGQALRLMASTLAAEVRPA